VSGTAREAVYGVSTSTTGSTTGDPELVRVFYTGSSGQPSSFSAGGEYWPGITCGGGSNSLGRGTCYRHPSVAELGENSAGKYLGRDSNGLIGGLMYTDSGLLNIMFSLPEQTTIGSTATFKYGCNANPPPPTSGTDYSSGVPSFTPDNQVDLI